MYLAHRKGVSRATFTEYNRDHPSMHRAFEGLIDSDRMNKDGYGQHIAVGRGMLEISYPVGGWDFAMMAMTAVRLGKPGESNRVTIEKESPKELLCHKRQ